MTDPAVPIEREPRRVRPPHDVRDDRFEHLHASDTATWRRIVRLDRLAALHEPLAGLPVADYEHHILEHLSGSDVPEVAVIVALLHRARAARALDVDTTSERERIQPSEPSASSEQGADLHEQRGRSCGRSEANRPNRPQPSADPDGAESGADQGEHGEAGR